MVARAARYAKGRGYGKIVKLLSRPSYIFRTTELGYAEHGTALVVLTASPAVHAEVERSVQLRGVAITQVRLGGTSGRSAKKGEWHMGGTRCDTCHTVLSTLRKATWYEATCKTCRALGPMELLARVASQWEDS